MSRSTRKSRRSSTSNKQEQSGSPSSSFSDEDAPEEYSTPTKTHRKFKIRGRNSSSKPATSSRAASTPKRSGLDPSFIDPFECPVRREEYFEDEDGPSLGSDSRMPQDGNSREMHLSPRHAELNQDEERNNSSGNLPANATFLMPSDIHPNMIEREEDIAQLRLLAGKLSADWKGQDFMAPALARRIRDFQFAQDKRRRKYGDERPWGILGLYDHLASIRVDVEWAEDAAWRRANGEP